MVTLRPFLREDLRFPYSAVQKPGDIRAGLVWFGQVPGSPGVYLGVHQSGGIWRIEKAATGDTKTLFADFSAEVFAERGPNGLVGLAFHPRFRENRKYYLKHQVLEAGEIVTTLVEKRAGRHHADGTPVAVDHDKMAETEPIEAADRDIDEVVGANRRDRRRHHLSDRR